MEKFFMAAMGGAIGVGNASIRRLVKYFGTAQVAWSADADELSRSGIQRNALEAFLAFRQQHPDAPKKLVGYCDRHKFNLCSIFDDDYPPILKQIKSAPMFFYYRGQLQPRVERIGIVGSRNNTVYGQTVALELGEELAASGLTVVSGAARGIDTFAHRGALKSGRTVAVLGCGIDIAFRSGKKKFYEQITESGVVLSEFPPQLEPNQNTFPARNRIIAGLCRGVIIVEAGTKSGALITGSYAGDFGRDVFAIPGQIYAEMSKGCHNLIRDGARLIKSARDVLDEYNIIVVPHIEDKQLESITLDGTAAKVFEVIPVDKFITDDEILMQLPNVKQSELSGMLLELEIKGCVEVYSNRYKRKPRVQVTVKQVESIALDGTAAKVFEVIPIDKFITDDEILMQLPDVKPNELSDILLKLEIKNFIAEDVGRYKRTK